MIGSINNFNENDESFENYCKRVDLFCKANDVKDDKKVSAFLTLIGPKVYCLAQNLLSPKDPDDCTFDEIKGALLKYYKPKVIIIAERFRFYSKSQNSNESIADYVAALKALAHTCEFGTDLTMRLRDKFVMGLAN